ncbi:M14 family zinc carboxypeptidase [Haliangium ochraceum]|uniref:Peptidase M14 carboxypeptidase A n=1 Tax=Haliangium ochraceum (strain DSM 14365 / JCM 11303 / SMP-2) TaxID=502025 RepID=D0LZJ8_HALO1|nr:M14 family zinc carboxypeptidase [Haliangium ochraceum]ACY17977.1 peptidase M14 carboxypeptidase A [Haliangium ochraceum DSM 14365]
MYRQVEIGETVVGRGIMALHFTPPEYARPRPPAVFIGAIHGDEPLGSYCLARLCDDLLERPPGRDTWIIPALNVDGLAGGTKNNANDVDLDRNFAAASWSASHRPGYGSGAAPESEPETQALVALIARVQPARIVTVRSPYRMVLWDGAGEALAAAMAERNGYELRDDPGYPRPGSLAHKYGVEAGCEVVTLEVPFCEEPEAWRENRSALRFAVDLPV